MAKSKRLILALVALLVVAAVAFGCVRWYNAPEWPTFDATKTDAPQAMVKMDRDFNHHLGDLIEVSLFLKDGKDSLIAPDTITIGGDFESNSKPDVSSRKGEDGLMLYRILLRVQTFKANPEGVLKLGIGYRQGEKRLNLAIKDQSIFWSNTYDGRKEMQEGGDSRISAYRYATPFIIFLALGSIAFLVHLTHAIYFYIKNKPKPEVDWRFQKAYNLYLQIAEGFGRPDIEHAHKELDAVIREHFDIGPVPASNLDKDSMDPSLFTFLMLNAPAIYSKDGLSEEEHKQLVKALLALLKEWRTSKK